MLASAWFITRIATHVSEANILNQGRVKVRSFSDFLQKSVNHIFKSGVLETTLPGLGERRSHGESDNNIVGVFGLTIVSLLDCLRCPGHGQWQLTCC